MKNVRIIHWVTNLQFENVFYHHLSYKTYITNFDALNNTLSIKLNKIGNLDNFYAINNIDYA